LFGGKKLKLNLDKLNIYTEGGHFQEHLDTPRQNMIGSLVVELPYKHSGGELKIYSNPRGIEYKDDPRFDPYSRIKTRPRALNLNEIQIIGFYGNCVHQITKVISGHRISVSFQILADTVDGLYDTDLNSVLTDVTKVWCPQPLVQIIYEYCDQSAKFDFQAKKLDIQGHSCSLCFGIEDKNHNENENDKKNKKKKTKS